MIRLSGRVLALLALALLPAAAAAQKEPPDTKETKEAQKFLGIAMMQQDPAKKRTNYEQAMTQLRVAMTKNPDNAKVWMLSGQVYVGIGDFLGADSAFKKAEALHPPYAEDVGGEREAAWVEAFNVGIQQMDTNPDQAIKSLELAEQLYPHRPEGKMNLGALYAGKNDIPKAVAAFEGAIAATEGPLKAKLKPEDAVNWKRYADMAKSNIAQLAGAAGVEHFNAKRFPEAAAAFQRAAEINPYARDYWFNLAQAYYAQVGAIEEKRQPLVTEYEALLAAKKNAEAKAKLDEANKFGPEMIPLYTKIVELSEKTLQIDPANTTLFDLIARSHKITGDLTADTVARKQWQQKALAALQAKDALTFEVVELSAVSQEGQATIRGSVKNLVDQAGKPKATPGAPLKILVTLLGADGAQVGQQEVTVAAPAAGESAPIEVKTAVTGEVAGWKYTVVK